MSRLLRDDQNVPDNDLFRPRSRLFTADRIDPRAARVATRRQALGLDPRLLDAILGFREGTIKRPEAGESRIGPSHLLPLADLFDVSVDWFFAEALDAECMNVETAATHVGG